MQEGLRFSNGGFRGIDARALPCPLGCISKRREQPVCGLVSKGTTAFMSSSNKPLLMQGSKTRGSQPIAIIQNVCYVAARMLVLSPVSKPDRASPTLWRKRMLFSLSGGVRLGPCTKLAPRLPRHRSAAASFEFASVKDCAHQIRASLASYHHSGTRKVQPGHFRLTTFSELLHPSALTIEICSARLYPAISLASPASSMRTCQFTVNATLFS